MTRHYLDHASTSPMRPEAVAAATAWMGATIGDPGRIHHEGLTARVAIEEARERVAAFFGARPREVVFTSGATEAVAAAIWGAAARGSHLVVPAVEHSAVRLAAEALAADGTHEVTSVDVDGVGRVDPEAVADAVRPDTALVCVQSANHEVATRQPVAAVVEHLRDADVLTLSDAATSAGHDPIDFAASGLDLLAVSAHKLGGPPGIGALLIRRGLRLRPLLRGGDQERARRAGLENLPAIAGFAAACDALTDGRLASEASAARARTDRVLAAVGTVDAVRVYGDPDDRVPHLICLGVDGVEPQGVLLGLDRAGIAAPSGSACSSESLAPSPVLEAMGLDAHHSLRISVGWSTTDADIDALLTALPQVVDSLRALGNTGR